MQSQNKKYPLILFGLIVFFLFFFSSKAWMPDDRKPRVQNYNQIVTMDAWQIKVSGAQYDSSSKTLTFQMFRRTIKEAKAAPDMSLYLGVKKASKTPLTYDIASFALPDIEKNSEAFTITVYNIPKDFWYVSVNLECEETSGKVTRQTDVFGQEIQRNPEDLKPKKLTQAIQIDSRKIKEEGQNHE